MPIDTLFEIIVEKNEFLLLPILDIHLVNSVAVDKVYLPMGSYKDILSTTTSLLVFM